MPTKGFMESSHLPICVDLDGTLVTTDTLVEGIIKLCKQTPLKIFLLPLWLLHGKSRLKREVATRAMPNVALLPYNQPLIQYLKERKRSGHQLFLVTASDQAMADAVGKHLGIFSENIGSHGHTNLKASQKTRLLIDRFGEKKFIYAGNAPSDITIWQHAAAAIVVNAKPSTKKYASQGTTIANVFTKDKITASAVIKQLRIHQWLKNILLFIPILTAHQARNIPALEAAALGFFSFSALASAIYLINDLLDLEADRQHQTKKYRPFAAGKIHPLLGIASIAILVGISLILSVGLPSVFFSVLLIYGITNFAYSLFLKQIIIVDVVILASLYSLRIFAGSAATGIPTSAWLFAFAMFLFMSLALLKRFAELHNGIKMHKHNAIGRGYTSTDRMPISILGITSGYFSLAIFALYINSQTVTQLYKQPPFLWLLIPLFMIWVSRIWLAAFRGEMIEDPLMYTTKDPISYIILIGCFVSVMAAT